MVPQGFLQRNRLGPSQRALAFRRASRSQLDEQRIDGGRGHLLGSDVKLAQFDEAGFVLQPCEVLGLVGLARLELLDEERIRLLLLLFPSRQAGVELPRTADDLAGGRVNLQDREVVAVFVVVVCRPARDRLGAALVPVRALDAAMRVAGKYEVCAPGKVAISVRAVAVGIAVGVGQRRLRMVQHRHRDGRGIVAVRVHEMHGLELRQAEPQLAVVRGAVAAEPRGVGADEAETEEVEGSGEVTRHGRGDAQVSGELDEGFEGPRKARGKPPGIEERVRQLRILRAGDKRESLVAVDIVIAGADDAIGGSKTGGGEQLLREPLGKLRVAGRLALPGQIARYYQDVGLPGGRKAANQLHQEVERLLALAPRQGVFVVAEVQVG